MKNILLFINLLLPFVVFSQTLVSISPSTVNAGQTLNFTITGADTKFTQAQNLTVTFFVGTVNSVTVINDLTLEVNVSIPTSTITDDYRGVISQLNNQMMSIPVFHVNGIPKPLLTSISPSVATNGQTLDVLLTGKNTHFASSALTAKLLIDFDNSVMQPNSIVLINDTLIKANITVPITAYNGYYSVGYYDSVNGHLGLPNAFQVTGNPKPLIVKLTPRNGVVGHTLDHIITGKNAKFNSGKKVVSIPFLIVNTTNVLSDSTIKVNVTIPSSASSKNYEIIITDSMDANYGMYMNDFYVYPAQTQLLVDVNPKSAISEQTLDVTITGINTHFKSSKTTFSFNYFGSDVATINSANIVNDTSAVVNITISRYASTGNYNVIATNVVDNLLFLGEAFHIDQTPFPAISSITPTAGDAGQTLDVTIKGSRTHFSTNETKVVFSFSPISGATTGFVNSVNVINDTILIANVTIPADLYTGTYVCYVKNAKDDNMYGGDFEVKNGIPVGILSHDNDGHFISVYPNPADKLITVMSSTPINALNKPVLSIYSIEGKLLLQQAFVKEKMTLDVGALQKGMYIMQLTGSKQTEIIKFTKE